MKFYTPIFLTFIPLLPLPAIAESNNICWVDHVNADADGVTIYFRSDLKDLGCYGSSHCPITTTNGTLQTHLGENEHISVYQMAEDVCTLTAESKNNQLGVTASSHIHLPGLPASEMTKFIATQTIQ